MHALCSIRTLVQNGLRRATLPGDEPHVFSTSQYGFPPFDTIHFTHHLSREAREQHIFSDLLSIIPGLETRLLASSNEEARLVADLVCFPTFLLRQTTSKNAHPLNTKIQKGVSSARSDDTKGLKGAILDWIAPKGQPLDPPLARNIKTDRGFHHDRTGYLLCPAGLDWSDKECVPAITASVLPDLLKNQGRSATGSPSRPR